MSFNYNHVTLVGRLTRDPDVKDINESKKAFFTLAINRHFKREDETVEADFIPVIMWGKPADSADKILKKGSPVLVWGRLQVRDYEKDKESRRVTEVIAENFQILGGKPKEEGETESAEA